MIQVFQPSLGEEELAAVREVFSSNWIGKGARTEEFEREFAGSHGVPSSQVVSISCCTEGLFQAMELLDFGPGDEVILPTISFVGAANAIAHTGAQPVFCDTDARTLNATARFINDRVTAATRAVIVLQYGGVPPEMSPIIDLCQERHLTLIEDTACGVMARYKGRYCGTLGDIGVWSFDAMKELCAGDGAMMYFKDAALADRARRSTYLGLTSSSGYASKVDSKWWEFEVEEFGRRAILNDITSAIGQVQLRRLPGFIKRRQKIWDIYQAELPLPEVQKPPRLSSWVNSSYYLYWIQSEYRDELAQFLKSRGVYTTFRYYPLHWIEAYGQVSQGVLHNAEWAAKHTLCLPLHQSLSDDDLDQIIALVGEFHAQSH